MCAIFAGMSDRLTVHADPPLESVDKNLATFAALSSDLRPFWQELGERLAADTQSRWPLKRKSGRLRRSLTWSGNRLGRFGIFQNKRDRLVYGSRLFYGAFSQKGTRHQPARKLIHVDQDAIAARLDSWMTERAQAAGLEATP